MLFDHGNDGGKPVGVKHELKWPSQDELLIACTDSTLTRISRRGLPSPPDAHERQALPGQSELQMGFAALHQDPRRRGEELQLSGALQLIVLLRGRRLRESHLLPSREGIAVMRVNAEMFDMREVHGFGQPGDRSEEHT